MRIKVKVKPNARLESVSCISPGYYAAAVNAPPREGEANEAIINAIAKFFKVPKSKVEIKSGLKSKTKVIEIHST
jgi:uncharacterized protein (TIGR00251 family)